MKKNKFKKLPYLLSFVAVAIFWGCNILGPTIASYDQYAYTQTTSLKVDALNLMDSAVYDYQSEVKNVATVKLNIQKLYEYDKNRGKNGITVKQWQILMDTNGHLFGGFLIRWRNSGKLKKPFIDNVKALVDSSFSQIAKLESRKIQNAN
jgi:hypothetical protein